MTAARRGRPGAAIHGVQEAAANSLTRMIGVDAAPIIEKELPSANDYMKSQLTKILARIDQ